MQPQRAASALARGGPPNTSI